MLKIKDDVDLKELEKFGFKPLYNEYTGEIISYEKFLENSLSIKKYKRKRIFRIFKYDSPKYEWRISEALQSDIDTLYDLIQANLVEKV